MRVNGNHNKGSRRIDVGKHIGKLHLLNDPVGPYELRIDPDGRWFHGGVEIVRKDIVRLFSRGLKRVRDGAYVVQLGADEAPVVVEDAPLVVLRVEPDPRDGLLLLLTDDSREPLIPETIVFRAGNVPYCLVRGNIEAKFSRQAYYQLASHIEHCEETGCYYLTLGDSRRKLDL